MVLGFLGVPIRFPFVCETRKGQKIHACNRFDLLTVWIIWLREEYTVDKQDKIILNRGANIGAFSVYASGIALDARIFGVEPFPSTFLQFAENIGLNRLETRVDCIPFGLSSADGGGYMETSEYLPSQSHYVVSAPDRTTIPVPMLSLSSLMNWFSIQKADLLKMDIEGSEHDVLLATHPDVLARFERISLEYHHSGPKETLFSHIDRAGFVLRRDRVLGKNYGVAEFVRRRAAHWQQPAHSAIWYRRGQPQKYSTQAQL